MCKQKKSEEPRTKRVERRLGFDVFRFFFVMGHDVFYTYKKRCSWKGCVFQGVVIEDSKNLCVLDSRISAEQRMTLTVRILGDGMPHFKTITRQSSIGHIADQLVTHLSKTVLDCALTAICSIEGDVLQNNRDTWRMSTHLAILPKASSRTNDFRRVRVERYSACEVCFRSDFYSYLYM